ncbi:MAG: hypothetical protein K8J31_29075 [Anaerolineae bacterium]|nr:hypothetical protein [Anaerolineae bacterium]
MSAVSLAQDQSTATPVTDTTGMQQPIQDDEADGATLETVTADTASFVGTTVTLQGTVAEFVNARTFVLAEGAAVDDDQVLVINTGSDEFDLHLSAGQRVQVTGTVSFSLDEGGFDEVATAGIVMMDHNATNDDSTMMQPTATMLAEMTPEVTADANAMQPTLVPDVTLTPAMDTSSDMTTMPATRHEVNLAAMRDVVNERYPNYTIVTVSSIDQIVWIPEQG